MNPFGIHETHLALRKTIWRRAIGLGGLLWATVAHQRAQHAAPLRFHWCDGGEGSGGGDVWAASNEFQSEERRRRSCHVISSAPRANLSAG
jgi:hypothetical protein